MNSRLTQAAYCRTRHHGNSILFFPLRPVLYNRPPHFSPPLLPRHVKIAGRPLASREESHASLMRPRPFHRLEPRTWPRHLARVYRAAYGDSIDIGILFNFFSPLSLSLSLFTIRVRFSARSLSGFRIDFSCGGFWQPE